LLCLVQRQKRVWKGATTFSITTIRIMTLSIRSFYVTLSINDSLQNNALLFCCANAECCILFTILLNAIMLSVVMLSVVAPLEEKGKEQIGKIEKSKVKWDREKEKVG